MRTALRRYYRGDELVGLRDGQANTTRYYHFDHQGTTQCLTDKAGAVTDRFASDAWGVQVKRTGTSINRQWYIGNWDYSDELTHFYVRARHYLKPVGTWMSRDPDPSLIVSTVARLYQYVVNSLSRFIDPTGRKHSIIGSIPVTGPQLGAITTFTGPWFWFATGARFLGNCVAVCCFKAQRNVYRFFHPRKIRDDIDSWYEFSNGKWVHHVRLIPVYSPGFYQYERSEFKTNKECDAEVRSFVYNATISAPFPVSSDPGVGPTISRSRRGADKGNVYVTPGTPKLDDPTETVPTLTSDPFPHLGPTLIVSGNPSVNPAYTLCVPPSYAP